MAKPATRSTSTPTATKGRKPRTPATSATPKAGKVAKLTPSSSAKRGRKLIIDEDGNKKKRRKIKRSADSKARNLRKAGKARRSLGSADDEKASVSAKASKGPKGPGPTEKFNDELKSTGLEWEAEKILDSKMQKGGRRCYLIKWSGYEDSENTWEPEVNLRNSQKLIEAFDKKFPDKP